jgi:two-component system sensor histidine kinase/response regulator
MTANASQADRERCLEAGMDEHISKPIDPDQLYHTLSVWLKPKDQSDVAESGAPEAHATEAPALDTLASIPRLASSVQPARSVCIVRCWPPSTRMKPMRRSA